MIKRTLTATALFLVTFSNIKNPNNIPVEYSYPSLQSENTFTPESLMAELKQGKLPIFKWLEKIQPESQNALAEGDSSCEALTSTARSTCSAAWTDYAHGALKYFNGTLCRLNKESTAEVENVLCHFRKSMGIKVDLASLPVTATKTFNSKTIVVTVAAPTETFATSAGYQAKGTVTVNGSTYMVLYWGGSGSSTKGFMIEGYVSGGLGDKRANYVTWDLTNTSSQFVKMHAASFPSGTYLNSAAKTGGSYRGDAAVYGQVTYNSSTKVVTTQVVMIEEQRSGGTAGQFGCFKMYASGTKDGTVTVAKTQNSMGGTGHATNAGSKQLSEMDGVTLTDSKTTANGTGTTISTQSGLESALGVSSSANVFAVSCNDILSAGSSGNIFSTGTTFVDFTKTQSAVFP